MSLLTSKLDDIASSLESKGLLKEAAAVDLIANTIEAYEVEAAWSLQTSPQAKALLGAMSALKAMNGKAAMGFLQTGDASRDNILRSFPDNDGVKEFSQNWINAKASIEQGDLEQAKALLDTAYKILGQVIAPLITNQYMANRPGQQPQAPGQQPQAPAQQPQAQKPPAVNTPGMFFPAKNVTPTNAPRKPLFNPGKREE